MESDVTATYQPMFVTYSTAKTPTKQGHPDNSMRALPKVSLFGTQSDESLIPLLSVLSTVGVAMVMGSKKMQDGCLQRREATTRWFTSWRSMNIGEDTKTERNQKLILIHHEYDASIKNSFLLA